MALGLKVKVVPTSIWFTAGSGNPAPLISSRCFGPL